MIDVKTSEDARFVEITMTAPISEDDYTTTLAPAIDKAIEAADHIRLLAIVEGGMSDFTFGALREDSRMGLKHWRGFDRVALVTDDPGIQRMVGMFSVFMPCPVAKFSLAETDTARLWLRESPGSIQIDALAKDTVVVRLMGKLDSETYTGRSEDLDTVFATMGEVGLVIDLREFDGWQGLGALKEHFALAHSHVGQLRRAAIVGDAGWQAMASKFGKHVVGLDARHFGASAYEEAIAWVQAPD